MNELVEVKIILINLSLNNFKGKFFFERWNIYKNLFGLGGRFEKRRVKVFFFFKEFEIVGNLKKVIIFFVYFGVDDSE